MKTVPLHGPAARGRVALVDDEDYDFVMQYRWNITDPKPGTTPYAFTNLPGGRSRQRGIQMHRLLTGYPLTDHHDRDGLNNQRANLRIATTGQNMANARARAGCASIYKGVSRSRNGRRWVALIHKDGKRRSLGSFPDEVSAALAYDTAARQLHGMYARVNFPNRGAGEVGALDYLSDDVSTHADDQEACVYTPDRAGTSKYLGVSWCSQKGKWKATVSLAGKQAHLGYHLLEIDAALAYDAAAPRARGDSARLNFPDGLPRELGDRLRVEREILRAEANANTKRLRSAAAAAAWVNVQPEERICTECSAPYVVRQTRRTFYCSQPCSSRAWWARKKLRDVSSAT